ncbi:hypothetical protein DM860_001920 [Cuscuta australis]|uniref:Uncharacterized protein n=1 Tax=Cuscuta australis TaxID=267555 RepID=A0A328DZ51_9ASTE|nr:hypothetical protein DM860_001920 [Cuscuta australis]
MAFYGHSGESQWPYSYPTQSLIPYPSPNLIQNQPNHCTTSCYYYLDYQPPISQTNYCIASSSSSHSTSAPDDEVFEEYDPDPYSGGYDIVQTYGKPLPPSNQTCYPCSATDETGAAGSYKGGNESAWESPQVGNDDAIAASSRYYGSGLEGVDLCGGVFGYWPCWEKHQKKKKKKGNDLDQEKCNRSSNGGGDEDSPWSDFASAADYIFGYGDLSYSSYQQQY